LPELPAVVTHPLIRQVAATRAWSAGRCSVAIAGTVPELLDVSRSASRSRPQVEFAVLAIERPGDAELTEESRDELWETFQVPVYRVLLGFDGRVLAHECEALRGLHAGPDALFEETAGGVYLTSLSDVKHPSVRLRIGLAARLEHGPCDCGRPGVRVAPVWQARERLSSAAD
jgi:phenylacetate-coenzyme A ligase PaaK-like adenylate-forming protein